MIVGYHCIFGAYGFWLPNDPRGSWSDFVGSWGLFRYGQATKTTETRSLAHRTHDRESRLQAKQSLKRPAVRINGLQARAVARGFAKYLENSKLPMWACTIMPDHVHLVVGPAHIDIEQVVIQLKGEATASLVAEGLHPFATNSERRPSKCFAVGGWNVYLDPEDVPRAIRYVEENPVRDGLPRQRWRFVTKSPYG